MVAVSRFPGWGLAEPHLVWELVLLPILILSELGGHWCDGVQSTGPQAGPLPLCEATGRSVPPVEASSCSVLSLPVSTFHLFLLEVPPLLVLPGSISSDNRGGTLAELLP